ncbi:hypothetical protein NQ176_g7031 [Zarea fungicola]|uniref:Uncharacterized protein n=1 Tax=Zarea fungicola TaxID=93591 RepID=A0ACC1N057_9HYPO|nr:hypothetical protein NQ176_g7031 [Lecanicillium fungicola]
MQGSSITANEDAPIIKGHEHAPKRRMTDLHADSDTTGLAISFPPNTSNPQRSETGSCSVENTSPSPSITSQRPRTSPLATKLTDSDSSLPAPKPSLPLVDTTPTAAAQARQGSRDIPPQSTNNNPSPGLDTPDLSSPCQESTWSHYAGRLRNISQLQSPTVYTTPAPRTRPTRESSPATSIRRSTPTTTPGSSTFSFIASKMSVFKALRSPSIPGADCGNELIDLDIEAALFPGGAAQEGQAFSPAAYKNLQMNAVGLLHRFQAAYQSQMIEFRTAKAEKEALEDEKSEAQTRAQHAKLQLEEVSRKAAEKEAALQAYIEELQQ